MIKHEILALKEQKYVGIKTVIPFKEAEQINYLQLHKNVYGADINDIDQKESVMAIDTDFTEDSFSYTPLVPVHSFDYNEGFTRFIREQGTYYAFEVKARDLNPSWFKRVFEYIKENNITIENAGYDLEYYNKDLKTMSSSIDDSEERVLKILLKMQS